MSAATVNESCCCAGPAGFPGGAPAGMPGLGDFLKDPELLNAMKVNYYSSTSHYFHFYVPCPTCSIFICNGLIIIIIPPLLHRGRRMLRGGTCFTSTHQNMCIWAFGRGIEMSLDELSCCSLKEIKKLEGEDPFYTEQPLYSHSQSAIRGKLSKHNLFSTQKTSLLFKSAKSADSGGVFGIVQYSTYQQSHFWSVLLLPVQASV